MTELRRFTDAQCWDATLIMGILYTIVYGAMIYMLFADKVPVENTKTLDLLVGAMTIIQSTIVQFFFGSSKNAENSQRMIAQSKERTDSAMREIVTAAGPAPASNWHKLKADDVTVQAEGDVTVERKP